MTLLLDKFALTVRLDDVLTLWNTLQMLYVTAPTVQAQMVYLIAIWYRPALLFPHPSVKHEGELAALPVAPNRIPEVSILVPLMGYADDTSSRHSVEA